MKISEDKTELIDSDDLHLLAYWDKDGNLVLTSYLSQRKISLEEAGVITKFITENPVREVYKITRTFVGKPYMVITDSNPSGILLSGKDIKLSHTTYYETNRIS